MGKLVFTMNVSIDGYVDDAEGSIKSPPPDAALFRHFIDYTRSLAGSLYGRRLYQVMQYWDEDQPVWGTEEKDFAAAWRAQPKWVVSRTLKSVGANATLVGPDLDASVRKLKASVEGEIAVGGPELASALSTLGLIDEYRLYIRAFFLGGGKPYFTGTPPPLRLVSAERIGADAVRHVYVPA